MKVNPATVETLARHIKNNGEANALQQQLTKGADLDALATATGLSKPDLTALLQLDRTELGQVFAEALKLSKQLTGAGADGTSGGASVVTQFAGKAPSKNGAQHVRMGNLMGVDKSKTFGALLNDPAVMARAAAETHTAWLSGGSKPGVRYVKDDPIISMQKAGLNVEGLKPEDAAGRLKELGLEMSPKHRTFAFAVDDKLNPVPKDAGEARVLDVLGKDAVTKQITDNNMPAIKGVAGALGRVLSGVAPTFIKAGEGYVSAARTLHKNAPSGGAEGKVNAAAIGDLIRQVEEYQAALKSAGTGDIVGIGDKHPVAHAIAGMIHDDFTGYRKENNIYMDDAQVVPYERLKADIAVLDLDPVLALLRSAAAKERTVGSLLNDAGVTARAAAETHMAWLSGGNKPGVRYVKDDPIVSMQKAGLNVDGLKPEDAAARLKELGLEMSPKHRTFAFAVDDKLNPVPKDAGEARVLDVLGKDAVSKQITDNNMPAIKGVAGALGRVLSGVKPTFIKADEGYESAARTQHTNAPAGGNAGKVDKAAIGKLISEVEGYQAALKAAGNGDIVGIGDKHPIAHAIAGMVHDDFTGYRKVNNIYMDDAQVVPYERLKADIAVLDLDPVLALLRSAHAVA